MSPFLFVCVLTFCCALQLLSPENMAWKGAAETIPDGWAIKTDNEGRCPIYEDCGKAFPPAGCRILGQTKRNIPCKR